MSVTQEYDYNLGCGLAVAKSEYNQYISVKPRLVGATLFDCFVLCYISLKLQINLTCYKLTPNKLWPAESDRKLRF
jgi:hypothetical protein